MRLIPQGSVSRRGQSGQKERGHQSREAWASVLAPGVTLDRFLSLCGLQLAPLSDGGREKEIPQGLRALLCGCRDCILSEGMEDEFGARTFAQAGCLIWEGGAQRPGHQPSRAGRKGEIASARWDLGYFTGTRLGAATVLQTLFLSCRFAVTVLYITECPHGQVSPS